MRQSITIRLDPTILSAARARAKANNRTLASYIETLLMRDLIDHGEDAKITVFAPEGLPDANDLVRDPGESGASHAERKEAIGAIIQAAGQR